MRDEALIALLGVILGTIFLFIMADLFSEDNQQAGGRLDYSTCVIHVVPKVPEEPIPGFLYRDHKHSDQGEGQHAF